MWLSGPAAAAKTSCLGELLIPFPFFVNSVPRHVLAWSRHHHQTATWCLLSISFRRVTANNARCWWSASLITLDWCINVITNWPVARPAAVSFALEVAEYQYWDTRTMKVTGFVSERWYYTLTFRATDCLMVGWPAIIVTVFIVPNN
jgi:hypothetical protein